MSNIIIKQVNTTSPEYDQVWELREEILRKPLGMSLKNEDLSGDAHDFIFIALKDDKVIGCVMLKPLDSAKIKLRAMAVAEPWQGKGIGKLLVAAAEKTARENGYGKIVLNARRVALGFYGALAYQIIGDEFTEVGIPHFAMEKEVS